MGSQLHAPRGFGSLAAGVRYYFLRNDNKNDKVVLCWFARHGPQWRVHLIRSDRGVFEPAVESGNLVAVSTPFKLPPWLVELEGKSFDEGDLARWRLKRTYREASEERFRHIAGALERCDAILASDDPLKELAAHAAACDPPQHPHRVQTWFFCYVLHGWNICALMPAHHLAGRWDRSTPEHRARKFGRPSKHAGSAYGFSVHVMRDQINKAYLDLCGLGRTMRAIHREALTKHFKCRIVPHPQMGKIIVQPEGNPFPSYGQFRRVVIEKYGLEQVQRTRWGVHRQRSERAFDIGTFTEPFANLLEFLVTDAYYVKERPQDVLNGKPMPPLCVVRGVCATSGMRCGIGFAFGKERSTAYREMLFSMAIPKSVLGRIYGVPLTDDDWPSIGVPPAFVSDRGPGAIDKLVEDFEQRFPVREIPPSHSGQSKAIVESTHTRDDRSEGEPTFVISHLNAIQMVRREVLLAQAENHRSNIAPRLTPQMVDDFKRLNFLPTPFHLWKYLDARYRTNAVSMSFDDAVRTFLTPVKFKAASDGLWLNGWRYHSDDPMMRKLLASIAGGDDVEIRGYALTMVVRCAWVEIKGQIVEVEAQLRIRDDREQLYMSLSQLEALGKSLVSMNSAQREYADAAVVEASQALEASTGRAWIGGQRRGGRPKKPSGAAKIESKLYGRRDDRKKAA